MDTIKLLFWDAVDYAGLFPPASLSLHDTVVNFNRYLLSSAHPMLGRLVVPVGQLDALQQTVDDLISPVTDLATVWRISALLPPLNQPTEIDAWEEAMGAVNRFNADRPCHPVQPMRIDSLEGKIDLDQIGLETIETLAVDCPLFIEVDLLRDIERQIIQIRDWNDQPQPRTYATPECRWLAKIRTGGVAAEQIPSLADVANFIIGCARYQVPFKATAGLHHPLRNEYRLTYQPNPPIGTMHGFVNVFMAALLTVEYDLPTEIVQQILNDREPRNFRMDRQGIGWGEWTIPVARIAELRTKSIQSFGSCSFTEPSEELAQEFGLPIFA